MTKRMTTAIVSLMLSISGIIFLTGCEIGSSGDSGGGSVGDRGEGGGFLWKPVSESDRKLVALLPPQYTGRASGAFVASSGGTVLDRGNYGGVHNGGRMHFRFPQQGGAYGNNVKLVADLNDGSAVHWNIPNGSVRTEY